MYTSSAEHKTVWLLKLVTSPKSWAAKVQKFKIDSTEVDIVAQVQKQGVFGWIVGTGAVWKTQLLKEHPLKAGAVN